MTRGAVLHASGPDALGHRWPRTLVINGQHVGCIVADAGADGFLPILGVLASAMGVPGSVTSLWAEPLDDPAR